MTIKIFGTQSDFQNYAYYLAFNKFCYLDPEKIEINECECGELVELLSVKMGVEIPGIIAYKMMNSNKQVLAVVGYFN